MGMIRKLKGTIHRHVHSELAENAITFLIALPLLWSLLMTMIDFSTFIGNTATLRSDLRDGARTAAIFGGTDNALSAAYGTTCASTSSEGGKKGGHADNNNIVACLVANKINANTAYVNNMTISGIECGPSSGTKVGQATWCSAHYSYAGMPGSALSLFGGGVQSFNDAHGSVATTSGGKGWNNGTIKVSAQSEVTTK
jgi:hypothetical protein